MLLLSASTPLWTQAARFRKLGGVAPAFPNGVRPAAVRVVFRLWQALYGPGAVLDVLKQFAGAVALGRSPAWSIRLRAVDR